MKFHSNVITKEPRSQIHKFQSKETALAYLKSFNIEPSEDKFLMIAERTYPEKTFDALDYLMFDHRYLVNWV